jgi:hypothetical protein
MRLRSLQQLVVTAALLALCVSGCKANKRSDDIPIEQLEAQLRVRPGRWRIEPSLLSPVRIRFASILVRHKDVDADQASVVRPGEAVTRTREEALRRAFALAQELAHHPERFENLARQASDDTSASVSGGVFGIVPALALEPIQLDALAGLKIGELEGPIETSMGFEIIKRLPVTPETHIAMRRILFTYNSARIRSELRKKVDRPRAAALAAANELGAAIRAGSISFAEAARLHSDAIDGDFGGDRGIWPTHQESGTSTTGLELLTHAGVGEVVGPLDTADGYELLVRTTEIERTRYATSAIVIFDVETDGAPRTRADSVVLASKIAAELKREPSRFGDLQEQYCGDSCNVFPTAWPARSGAWRIEAALDKLPIGGVSDVVDTPAALYILRRENPETASQEPTPVYSYEMPQPEPRTFSEIILTSDPETLITGMRMFFATQTQPLQVTKEEMERCELLMEQVELDFRSAPVEQRTEIVAASERELVAILGVDRFKRFKEQQSAWVRKVQFGPI